MNSLHCYWQYYKSCLAIDLGCPNWFVLTTIIVLARFVHQLMLCMVIKIFMMKLNHQFSPHRSGSQDKICWYKIALYSAVDQPSHEDYSSSRLWFYMFGIRLLKTNSSIAFRSTMAYQQNQEQNSIQRTSYILLPTPLLATKWHHTLLNCAWY